MKRLLLLAAFAASSAFALADEPPMSAANILKQAEATAKHDHKNVMVIFHASWCGWCHRLDNFLTTTDEGKIVSSNFVIVHLDVLENGDKKSLENSGADILLKDWGGDKGGIPFTVVLNPAGKKLIDSNRPVPGKPAANIGYPGSAEEIAHFMSMIEKGSKMNAADRAKVADWLKKNAPAS